MQCRGRMLRRGETTAYDEGSHRGIETDQRGDVAGQTLELPMDGQGTVGHDPQPSQELQFPALPISRKPFRPQPWGFRPANVACGSRRQVGIRAGSATCPVRAFLTVELHA